LDKPPGIPDWTDYEIEVDLTSQSGTFMGVMFRVQDAQNYYRVTWGGGSHANYEYLALEKCRAGLFTRLAELSSFAYTPGIAYALKIRANGSDLSVWTRELNGSYLPLPDLTASDASFAAGTMALYAYDNATVEFDNIVVTDLGGPTLLNESFGDGVADGWSVVDESLDLGPSSWAVVTPARVMAQSSSIRGRLDTEHPSIPRRATFVYYTGP
jgi:hypothetical protein